MSVRTLRYWLNDIFDVVDWVRNTSVFSNALVSEVNLAVSVNSNVLKKSVTTDSVVDIWFAFLIQVDNLSVATAFVVEYAFVVPNRVRRHR